MTSNCAHVPVDASTAVYTTIVLSEVAGSYRLTLNRPDRLNAFTDEMHREVADAVGRVEADPQARVLLITGAGRAFCAGQDLAQRDVNAGPLDLSISIERYYNPLARRLAALPVPVLCAVNGVAAGAGVNLAIACDLVIARKSAKFAQAFSSIGLIPDCGGTWTLPHLVGQQRAMGFVLAGETLPADKAEALGMIWKAVADEDFEAEVETVMRKFGNGPTFGLASAKRLIRASWVTTFDQALDAERDAQRACGHAPDYREGVNAFKDKRPPIFSGARPSID